MTFYLASASPRRSMLLTQLGLEYIVRVSAAEEIITKSEPALVVEELSDLKAKDIADALDKENISEYCVIGSDTVVAHNGRILGKPADEQQAFDMLCSLSGQTHSVYTGVTLYIKKVNSEREVCTFHEKTDVKMYEMTETQIKKYIKTGEPMDKAGAYGIQGYAAAFVEGTYGDYNNVVGLPIGRLYQELCKLNLL